MIYLFGKKLEVSREGPIIRFPSGETLVRLNKQETEANFYSYSDNSRGDRIILIYKSDQDIMDLIVLVDALQRIGFSTSDIDLVVPYLPSSRADRTELEGEAHVLYVYSQIISNLGFRAIITYDVHSTVAQACFKPGKFTSYDLLESFNYLQNYSEELKVCSKKLQTEKVVFVAPDKGAVSRAKKFGDFYDVPTLYAEKERDYETGLIRHSKVNGMEDVDISTTTLVVVDDICAGGGTFVGLANTLIENYGVSPEKLMLIVTHGLYNDSEEVLSNIKRVYKSGVYSIFNYISEPDVIKGIL